MMDDKERLVKLETQLILMVELLQEIRTAQKDTVSRHELEKIENSVEHLRLEIKELKVKYENLNISVIKILTVLGLCGALAAMVIKKIIG